MTDQYGLTPKDYVDDLKRLSNKRYGQGMLFFYSIVLEAMAEAISSHFCYFDAI